jgi:hypothetical protein
MENKDIWCFENDIGIVILKIFYINY